MSQSEVNDYVVLQTFLLEMEGESSTVVEGLWAVGENCRSFFPKY